MCPAFTGLILSKDNRKYRATIFKGNKPCHIGYFRDPVEAAKAYDREAIKTRGPHTATNFDVSNYLRRPAVPLVSHCSE
eukprot:jgi/Astpho2/3708/Aster-x0174